MEFFNFTNDWYDFFSKSVENFLGEFSKSTMIDEFCFNLTVTTVYYKWNCFGLKTCHKNCFEILCVNQRDFKSGTVFLEKFIWSLPFEKKLFFKIDVLSAFCKYVWFVKEIWFIKKWKWSLKL